MALRTPLIPSLLTTSLLALGVAFAAPAQADTLLIERVQAQSTVTLPARGLSMAQVEAQFGAPTERLQPRGGESAVRPVINRWSYPQFIVYFERDRVINAVLRQASPTEAGPKPVEG